MGMAHTNTHVVDYSLYFYLIEEKHTNNKSFFIFVRFSLLELPGIVSFSPFFFFLSHSLFLDVIRERENKSLKITFWGR